MTEARFKTIAVTHEFHAKLAKLSDQKSKELGTKISVPKIVEMMFNKVGGSL